ncbi:spore coat U domain-containing protein [bacterium]|nr:spore coat U domain-containing protein [bacterium]
MRTLISLRFRFCNNCHPVGSTATSSIARISKRNALITWIIVLVIALIAQQGRACSLNVIGTNFGSYDMFSNVPLHSSGNIDINCPKGVGYNITLSVGNGTYEQRVMGSGAHALNYNLYTDANRVLVWGDATNGSAKVSSSGTGESVNHVVYGRIPAHQNVYPGSYSDTITVVINF